MLRSVASLLCAGFAFAVSAAPAPVYKPKSSRVWFTGWDKPVDPVGGCRFDRDGDQLTIVVPAKGSIGDMAREVAGPRLLRDVEGDFVVQVRVGVDIRRSDSKYVDFGAGVLVTDGIENVEPADRGLREGPGIVKLTRILTSYQGPARHVRMGIIGGAVNQRGLPSSTPAYLRVERRGGAVKTSFSQDGRHWTVTRSSPDGRKLPRKLKVGVIAEADGVGSFEAVFDEFELTP